MKISDEAILAVLKRLDADAWISMIRADAEELRAFVKRATRIQRWCGQERWDAAKQAYLREIGVKG